MFKINKNSKINYRNFGYYFKVIRKIIYQLKYNKMIFLDWEIYFYFNFYINNKNEKNILIKKLKIIYFMYNIINTYFI